MAHNNIYCSKFEINKIGMNKLVFPLLAGVVLLASCKENDAPVTLGSAAATDTTYSVTPVPTADTHNALVELFSGQSCSNCPAAAVTLDGIVTGSPTNSINTIDYYVYNITQTTPPTPGLDLRTNAATSIGTAFYGGPGMLPVAGIDRVPNGTSGLVQQSGTWSSSISSALGNNPDSINLFVSSSYNASTLTATIVTKVTYLQNMTTKQNINIALVEDSITGVQEYPPVGSPYPSSYDSNYVYMNVCRDILTQLPQGTAVLDTASQKTPGLVSQTVYTYHFDASKGWLPQHCRIIAFVTDQNGEVMQSEQTKLTN